jgi:NitT/TauT family transport system ATP-binding protein
VSRRVLSLGFVPLTDCAPLVVAHEMGFAEEEGIALSLSRAPSWATLRDRLAVGEVDAAHMLAPVPVASAIGLPAAGPPTEALQVLSLNGIVVGLSLPFADRLAAAGLDVPFGDAAACREALRAAGPLTLAVPFHYSMQRESVHRWLGDLPDLTIRTVPPPLMSAALERREIDAFCVGEPLGSVAVEAGLARLILPGTAIWQRAPEKVLAVRAGWAEADPEATGALMRAIWRSGRWLADPAHRAMAVELLSRSAYLDRATSILERGMTGQLVVSPDGALRQVTELMQFHDGAATFPWRSQAAWIGVQLARRHGRDPSAARVAAQAVFRTDLYRQHLAGTGAAMPSASARMEGALVAETAVPSAEGRLSLSPDAFFDGIPFDPDAELPEN